MYFISSDICKIICTHWIRSRDGKIVIKLIDFHTFYVTILMSVNVKRKLIRPDYNMQIGHFKDKCHKQLGDKNTAIVFESGIQLLLK